MLSSRWSSWPRDQTQGPLIAGRFFTTEPPGKAISRSISIILSCVPKQVWIISWVYKVANTIVEFWWIVNSDVSKRKMLILFFHCSPCNQIIVTWSQPSNIYKNAWERFIVAVTSVTYLFIFLKLIFVFCFTYIIES